MPSTFTCIGILLFSAVRFVLSGDPPKLAAEQFPGLVKSGEMMQEAAAKADQGSSISPQLWPPDVRALSPVTAYSDRANIVIALCRAPQQETGLYLSLPRSSWLPISGDGWSFDHLGRGVYRYTRALKP